MYKEHGVYKLSNANIKHLYIVLCNIAIRFTIFCISPIEVVLNASHWQSRVNQSIQLDT